MNHDALKKELAAHERTLRDAIAYMERNRSPHWDDERKAVAAGAREARLQRNRVQSQLDQIEGTEDEEAN